MPGPVIVNIDDHEPARYARTRMLRRAGFDVHEAGTGAEGIALVDRVQADLVLLDVNLPDMSGLEVCRTVKSRRGTVAVTVIHISATAITPPQASAGLNSGADAYLTEPLDPEVLVATINAFLRLQRAERELTASNERLQKANAALEHANHALRRSNEDLEHFAYVASHDLQEPLRTVSTHTQLLTRSLGDRLLDHEKEYVGFIVEAARRMSALIADVLTYSRSGLEAPGLEKVPLMTALSWAQENLHESIAEAGAEIHVEPLPIVWGDSMQLAQVFQNIIGNALKYREPDVRPCVHIGAEERTPGEWTIFVRDNGCGIQPEHHEQIFGAFKRLHGREIPGTGIGLALCRRIVDAHGGRIWVESDGSCGSTFRFTLRGGESARSESAGRQA